MIRPIVDLFKSECIVVSSIKAVFAFISDIQTLLCLIDYSYNTIYLTLTVHKAEAAVHGQQKTGTAPCPAPP